VFAGCFADGDGVGDVGGERLLDHGADATLGGCFDDFAVILDVGVDEHCVGMKLVKSFVEIAVEELLIEMEQLCVPGHERWVGLDYADQLDIGVFREGTEESSCVIVDEANDDHANRRGCVSKVAGENCEGENQCDLAELSEQESAEHK